MPKYRVYFSANVESYLDVEADDEYEADEMAQDLFTRPELPGEMELGLNGPPVTMCDWEVSDELPGLAPA